MKIQKKIRKYRNRVSLERGTYKAKYCTWIRFRDTFCQDLVRKNDTLKTQHQRHYLICKEYLSLDPPFTHCLQQRILI
jgi:hypothetical protein